MQELSAILVDREPRGVAMARTNKSFALGEEMRLALANGVRNDGRDQVRPRCH